MALLIGFCDSRFRINHRQARSYVQARGGSFLLVPRCLDFFETQINAMINCVIGELRVKIVATRCQILWLKCTKFDFGWGSDPDSAGGAYSAPQTP